MTHGTTSGGRPAGLVRAGEGAGADGLRWGQLMAAAQSGDAGAYRVLLGEVAPWLRRYYGRRLPPAVLEDAVQDVLLAVHDKRHTYDPARPFAPWLAAIARYKWIDRLRSMKLEATEPLDEAIGQAGHEDAVVAGVTSARLLAMLKPTQADAIRLVKLEGFSVEEAARATGQSVPLVKVNVHRGLRRLMAIVRRTGDAD